MKKFNSLMVVALLVSALSAQAGVPGFRGPQIAPAPAPTPRSAPEGCWPGTDPKSAVVDGEFVAYVNSETLSGKEVVQTLAAINVANDALNDGVHDDSARISANDFSDTFITSLTAKLRKGESRAQLIERANAAIHKLQAAPGVSVTCDHYARPLGGISGSN